jgi:hypothetical protein
MLTWLESLSAEPFCCFGIPGSGKTVLASAVIDAVIERPIPQLAHISTVVFYHYCDYTDADTLDATAMISNFAQQVLDLHSSCVPRIMEKCRYAFDTGFPVSWEDAVYCLEESLKTTGSMIPVLDGIDEMAGTNQDFSLSLLRRLADDRNGLLRTFIFARQGERAISRHLKNPPSIMISTDDNNADLLTYIQSRLQTCIDSGDLLLLDEHIAQVIIDRLIVGAEHM